MPTTILRPYFLTFKNRIFRSDHAQHNLKRDLMLLGVSAAIMLCIFLVFAMIFINIKDNPLFVAIIPQKIVELLFYAFFIVLLLSNTVAAIGAIYSAKNMDLLLYTPSSTLRLYLAKVSEMLAESSFMLVVFTMPTALAFYFTLDVQAEFLLSLALLSIPFLLTPIGFAVLFATLFVRFSATFWKRGSFFIGLIFALALFALYKTNDFLNEIDFNRGGTKAILQITGFVDNPNPMWLPSRWASEIIGNYFGSPITSEVSFWSLLCVTAIGSLALGFLVFDIFLLRVRSIMGTQATFSDNSVDPARKFLEIITRLFPVSGQYRSIILKDLSCLLRDRSQSLQLLMFLGISLAYVILFKFMTIALNLVGPGLLVWKALLASFNVLFTGFILTAIMTRLVYPSVSLEGKAFWILITSPIDLRELINAKFWCWLPLSTLMAVALLVLGCVAIGLKASTIIGMIFIAISLACGCTGLAIGLGASFASFEWESPNQLSAGFGTLVLLGFSLTLVTAVCVPATFFCFFSTVEGLTTRFGPQMTYIVRTVSLFVIIIINIFAATYSCKRGAIALRQRQV